LELEVVAVSQKSGQFSVLPIVADADDRSLGSLYYLNQRGDASSVTSTTAVNLVHHDDALLSGLATDSFKERVSDPFLFAPESALGPVVEGLVLGKGSNLKLTKSEHSLYSGESGL